MKVLTNLKSDMPTPPILEKASTIEVHHWEEVNSNNFENEMSWGKCKLKNDIDSFASNYAFILSLNFAT